MQATGSTAPPICCSTSRVPRRSTECGSAISRTCPWPTATGPASVLFRMPAPNTYWTGRCEPICPRSRAPEPYSGRCWPSGPRRVSLSTPTAAGSTWVTPTKPCCTGLRPSSRIAGTASATTTSRPKALWSRLKNEELEARDWPVFADLSDVQVSVADYFDSYNHE